MRKIIYFTCCLLLSGNIAYAQSSVNITNFLETFQSQEQVVFQNKKNDFVNTHSYEIPLLKKLQFRTEMNGFDFQQQEYLVRANINSFKKINYQNKYQASVRNRVELDLVFAKSVALKERYDILINLIGLTSILEVKKQQKVLYQDRVGLYKKSILFPEFDILDLIEADDVQHENEQDILDLQSEILIYDQYIQQLLKNKELIIDYNGLIEIDKIKEIINNDNVQNSNHPQLRVLHSIIDEDLMAYELEQAKSKFSLGYIQARFADDEKDPVRQKISIGIGFDIPLKNLDRLDFNDLQLDIFESQSIFEATSQQLRNNQNVFYIELQNVIEKYALIQEQLDDNKATFALQEYGKFAEASPAVLLKLRERTLDKELLLKETKLKIFKGYINYLDALGVLSQQPYKNYLLQTLQVF